MTPAWTPPQFDELFHSTAAQVRSFLRRHADPGDVDDLLVETFAVAWSRLDRVPERPLPWLLTVARHMARRHWRSRRRLGELQLAAVRAQWTISDESSPEAIVLARDDALAALEQCSELEREALLLTAWDGLTASEAARVAGCSTRAFTVRLSRARARFDRAIGVEPPPARVAQPCRPATTLEQS